MRVALLPAVLAVSVLHAQQTLHVGPSGYANVAEAIAAADEGDEIVIAAGTYDSPFMTKGLTLRADPPGSVLIAQTAFPMLVLLYGGKQAHFVGLRFQQVHLTWGSATFEDCVFEHQGIQVSDSVAHFERCTVDDTATFIGNPRGALRCSGSHISAVHCTMTGASVGPAGLASPAVELSQTTFHGSNLNLAGGAAGTPSASAIVGDCGSVVRISDSTFTVDPGVCAIQACNAACDRCIMPSPCSGLLQTPLLGVSNTAPLRAGASWTASFQGNANDLVLLVGSYGIELSEPAELTLPLLLETSSIFLAAALVTDASGSASATWQLPSAPLPVGTGVWVQGAQGSTIPLLTSPVVGGVVRP